VKSANLLEVVDLGRDLFAKHIIRPPIKDHIISAILSLLRIGRDGYVINRSTIKHCVDILLQLSDDSYGTTMYKRYLEPLILRQSHTYYSAEAERLLVTCNALEYLRGVNPLSLQLIFLAYSYVTSGSIMVLRGRVAGLAVLVITDLTPSFGCSPGCSLETILTNVP